eukprot:TRINITY_DN3978_c0_g1_i1.p1 TRINITY_DN3978_c0_g1~~TRINITY_DN3978_c0_g1_i1.p1  ORF type:complete len:236 (-),score=47.11 TRINITY_DN3978_c0_g1_i1:61-768(-)
MGPPLCVGCRHKTPAWDAETDVALVGVREAALGVALAFCGGSFMVTVATCELLRATDFRAMLRPTGAAAANPPGTLVDAALHDAMTILGIIISTMVALHFRIGRTVLYGSTLGEGVAAVTAPWTVPLLTRMVTAHWQPWVPSTVTLGWGAAGFAVAWGYPRHANAVRCGWQGFQRLEDGLGRLLGPKHGLLVRRLAAAVAALGVAVQFRRHFRPLPLLAPLLAVEFGIASFLVAW